jgi:hypothetical protein
MQALTVKIENAYSDGHESQSEVILHAPDDLGRDREEALDFLSEEAYPHTGDGHGIDNDLGSCYVATIIAADDPNLLNLSVEWID